LAAYRAPEGISEPLKAWNVPLAGPRCSIPIADLTWAETHGRAWTAHFPKHLAIAVGFENDPAFERKPPEEALL